MGSAGRIDSPGHLITLADECEGEATLGMNRFSINVIDIDPFVFRYI
jgi:hypothetical protein